MINIVIIGAGDLGKEIVWLIEDINRVKPTYVILGFLDDDASKAGGEFYGYRVLGNSSDLERLADKMPLSAVIAIQDGKIRASIIHPTAVIASTSPLGIGSVVFPHVTVSVDSKIGEFELLYINSVICNDCLIGDYVSIMTGASVSERAEIGNECFLSAGSTIYPHKKLGARVEVGVEATASKDYEDDSSVSERGSGFSLFK